MKGLIICFLSVVVGLVSAMTEDEFRKLYASPKKDAETCWALYEAYAQGDGVEKSETQARKWLLAAHRKGRDGSRAEMEKLAWRKAFKGKKSIKIAEADDATARTKGEELVRLLMKWSGPSKAGGIGPEKKLPSSDMKTVRKLIAEGADLNAVIAEDEFSSYTALSLACHHNELALAKLLIDHGADPNACSALAMENVLDGGEEISSPQASRSKKALLFLLKNGLDVDMWTECGWSMAMQVSFSGGVSNMELLVKNGLNVNKRSNINECVNGALTPKRMDYFVTIGGVKQGKGALQMSAANVKSAFVAALLRNGADPRSMDDVPGCTLDDMIAEAKKASEKKEGAPHVLKAYGEIYRMLSKAKTKSAKKGSKAKEAQPADRERSQEKRSAALS